ncbi:DUF4430 domain-containing protein [[Eubacterium] cellulosolvens]
MKKILFMATILIAIISLGIFYISKLDYSSDKSIKVTITITKYFGKELLLEETIPVAQDISALEASKQIAEIETKYGGGFVSSINNVSSSYPNTQYDWFFYVNGFLSRTGASDYMVMNGDSIVWDYHRWDGSQFQSAILGSYPKYFTNGYSGEISVTIIAYEKEFATEAENLRKSLSEKSKIDVKSKIINELSESEESSSNLIILAKPSNQLVSELNEIHKRIGFFAFFNEDIIKVIDQKGELYNHYESAGLIQISQNIWNPKGNLACENVVILISGTEEDLIKKSVGILIHGMNQYNHAFGLVITETEVIQIP